MGAKAGDPDRLQRVLGREAEETRDRLDLALATLDEVIVAASVNVGWGAPLGQP
jgi:hypothetical protein